MKFTLLSQRVSQPECQGIPKGQMITMRHYWSHRSLQHIILKTGVSTEKGTMLSRTSAIRESRDRGLSLSSATADSTIQGNSQNVLKLKKGRQLFLN